MPVKIKCPKCSAVFNVADNAAGKKVSCPKCESGFVVKAAAPSAPKGPAAPPAKTGVKPGPARANGKTAPAAPPGKKSVSRPRDDDDDAPESPPKKKGSPVLMILGIIGGVCLLMCLGCVGVVGYAAYTGVTAWNDFVAQFSGDPGFPTNPGDGGNGGQFPGVTNPINIFNPGDKITTVDQALAALKSNDRVTKGNAGEFLAKAPVEASRQAEVARALDAVVDAGDPYAKPRAVKALATWADKDSVPSLCKALDADTGVFGDDTVRQSGFAALVRLKDERGAVSIAKFLGRAFVDEVAKKALNDMGPVAEKAVLAYYHSDNGGARERAQWLIQNYGTAQDAIVRQSLADLKSTNTATRGAAVKWLAEVKEPPQEVREQVSKQLETLLRDPDQGTRDWALRGLRVWGTKANVPALIKIIQDPTRGDSADQFHRLAIEALAQIKDEQAIPVIVASLAEPAYSSPAEKALVAFGAAAHPELKKWLDSDNKVMRNNAARVLKLAGSKDNPELTLALGDLKSPDANRRREGSGWIARQTAPDKERQAETFKALEAALEDTDQGVRMDAARAMPVWATADNSKTLIKYLNHPDDFIRQPMVDALGALKDEAAIVPLCQLLTLKREDRTKIVKALQTIGPKSETTVVQLFQNPDRGVRMDACKVLEVVGTKASLQALNAAGTVAVAKKEKDVQNAVASAIAAISTRVTP